MNGWRATGASGKTVFRRLDALLDELQADPAKAGAPSAETIDAEHGRTEGHDAERPRDRHDARLQRAAQLVFDCWTKPELVRRWLLGPAGWSMPVCQIDLRVGGAYRFEWRHVLNGYEMAMGGIYHEIAPPGPPGLHRNPSTRNGTRGDALGTMVFTERSGTTTLAQTILYESKTGPRHGAESRRWRKASPPISTGSPSCWHRAPSRQAPGRRA